ILCVFNSASISFNIFNISTLYSYSFSLFKIFILFTNIILFIILYILCLYSVPILNFSVLGSFIIISNIYSTYFSVFGISANLFSCSCFETIFFFSFFFLLFFPFQVYFYLYLRLYY